ncbi:hypothetical protein nbrc107696_11360 [Gordonia spumicola]|uniref:DAGKc domain-containing protein n=1 Tax=Gordonia spumicola TaxID=589161 RepID=A0A7I9V6I2_9ACTN|nr:diacylglycerol kinase family protein [Gordonia spumicola]GEE00690.1 hypothetical protein nbrc107696_11360 [Gordonia spumicola]
MRLVAIVNPISGGGAAKEQWPAVEAELARLGVSDVEVIESTSSADATALAAAAARDGAVAVAVGGDGQVRDVAAGVLTVDGARMGIAAAGRGNDLVRHLGLPLDPVAIAQILAGDRVRRIDVLDIATSDGSTVTAVGNVYVGLDSVATELINRLRWMGRLAYRVAPVLTALRWKPFRVALTIDGHRSQAKAHMVVIANSGDYGHGLRMVPSASVDSGSVEVMLLRGEHSVFGLASLMKQAKTGAHVDRREVEFHNGTTVTIDADRPLPVHADGDLVAEFPVTVTLRSAVLPILV